MLGSPPPLSSRVLTGDSGCPCWGWKGEPQGPPLGSPLETHPYWPILGCCSLFCKKQLIVGETQLVIGSNLGKPGLFQPTSAKIR